MRLENKVAIVTGGARGIGRAIAERYVAEGARVAIADIDGDNAARTAAAIGNGAFAVAVDIARQDQVDAMVEAVVARDGRIDILVNNAAIFDTAPLLELTREQWKSLFSVNVEGLFFTLQAVAAQMVAKGEGGKIINLASQAGRHGVAMVSAYCATKAAVISITQSAALELIRHKINVNAIAPGVVDTPMWDRVDALFVKHLGLAIGERKRQVGAAVPFGRMGVAEDLAGAAVFLASPDADYVVGQTLNVDGGNRLN
jgi:NAD(P)-dependent dehydrogenase (short-subunit alcohol dehydrogenase family)